MLKKFIGLGVALWPLVLTAQITINAQLPPAGLVQKDQLWNLVLVNNKPDIISVNIKLSLQDAVTGQVVLSANSGDILLGKGLKVITSKDVQPIQYNYYMADFSRSYLPMGTYVACYQVNSKQEPVAEDCININIEPLSPPLLNTPADKAEVETPYPQFTWIPPAPLDMFSDLSYDIMITEIIEGQSPTEAIQYNTPIYSSSNLLQPYMSYASAFSALEKGKKYAWEVIAKNGLNYAVKTEVWTFSLKKNNKAPGPAKSYILLHNDLQGLYITENDTLFVKYYSYDASFKASILISDPKGAKMQRIQQLIIPGDNYLDLALPRNLKENVKYQLILFDANKKTHSLTFSIHSKKKQDHD